MSVGVSDAISALRRGLRHFALLFLGCFLAIVVVLPALIARGEVSYDDTALVAASRLDMGLEALPRYAEETFDSEVARAITAAWEDDDIIPDRVSLVAEQDSIVLQIIGHDGSAQKAADIANLAAGVFERQLDLPGDGVGSFAIQSQALPSTEPVDRLASAPLGLAVGTLAGLITGLASVSVLLIARRPVLDAADAAEVGGVPVLGTVTMPRLRAPQFPAADVDGLVPLCRRLLAMHPRAVLLMAAPGSEGARGQLSVAMAGVLGRVRVVRSVTALEVQADAYAGEDVRSGPAIDRFELDDPSNEIILVDGPHPTDVVAPVQPSAILSVAQGIPEKALQAAVAEHLDGHGSDRLLMLRWRGVGRGIALGGRSGGRKAGAGRPQTTQARTQRYAALAVDG